MCAINDDRWSMENVMALVSEDQSWAAKALCAGSEPDALFVQGAAQRQVRQRCRECPVRLECLADALESDMNFGVWGGLTERERRVLARAYPRISDWLTWLRTSQDPLAVEIRSTRLPHLLAKTRVSGRSKVS